MAEICRIWSLTGEQRFQGLCSMSLKSETENDTTQCTACVTPLVIECGGSGGNDFGTTTWVWDYTPESYFTVLGWIISTNECQCAGRPVEPIASGEIEGETMITDCVRR